MIHRGPNFRVVVLGDKRPFYRTLAAIDAMRARRPIDQPKPVNTVFRPDGGAA